MNKISYQLKDPSPSKESVILMLYSCIDGRLRYYTGQAATSKNWQGKAQLSTNKGVQAQLSKINRLVHKYADGCRLQDMPVTRTGLKEYLDSELKPAKRKEASNLFERMTAVIDKMESGKLLTPGKKRYSAQSVRTFRFTVTLLQCFDPAMRADQISMKTYYNFISWCQERDYSNNYIGSQIKNFKTIGRAATGNPVFDHEDFKKITEATYDVYLNETELKTLFDLRLSGEFAVIRDWFILDCYTGLRVSDLVMLEKRNISKGFITIANEKTDEKVVIPVHRYVSAILKRNDGFPPAVSDVKINKLIKLICEKAEINDRVLFTITKGGKRKDEYLKKWQMVSCHTARRSFITNLRKNGVPDSIIMKLTGIRAISTLMRYDKISAEEAARVAAGLQFFS